MPRYTYKCIECDKVFEVTHSMKEKYTHCDMCGEPSLTKIFSPITKKKQVEEEKVGSVVKKHIEEAKEDIRQEKEKLRKTEFEPK